MRRCLFLVVILLSNVSLAQSIRVKSPFDGGNPNVLYMGFKNSIMVEGLTKRHKLDLKHGRIGKSGSDIFVIEEEFCNTEYEDSLRIYYNEIPVQTFAFSVKVPRKDTLAIIVGNNCGYRVKRETILSNSKLFVFPQASEYVVDSFSITILLERGDVIGPFNLIGNDFSSFKDTFKKGTKIYFENISASSRRYPKSPLKKKEKYIRFE